LVSQGNLTIKLFTFLRLRFWFFAQSCLHQRVLVFLTMFSMWSNISGRIELATCWNVYYFNFYYVWAYSYVLYYGVDLLQVLFCCWNFVSLLKWTSSTFNRWFLFAMCVMNFQSDIESGYMIKNMLHMVFYKLSIGYWWWRER